MYILLSNSSLEDRNFTIGGGGRNACVGRSIGSMVEKRGEVEVNKNVNEAFSRARDVFARQTLGTRRLSVTEMDGRTNVYAHVTREVVNYDPVGIKI